MFSSTVSAGRHYGIKEYIMSYFQSKAWREKVAEMRIVEEKASLISWLKKLEDVFPEDIESWVVEERQRLAHDFCISSVISVIEDLHEMIEGYQEDQEELE